MTSIGKLWTFSYQPTGRRIRAVIAFTDLPVEIPDNFKYPETNRSPEFKSKFVSWVSFADAEIDKFTGQIFQMLNGAIPYHKDIHAKLTESQIRSFDTLEKHLSNGTFLVSDKITLADITMASVLSSALYFTLDATLRMTYPNIVRFYEGVIDHPKLKDINWTREYVEKAREYVPKE
ncbi:glutathione S-transferase [Rickenella mellea]|uniref:Glutathione S-transferase n=1 Tax=Rickenella mellea TaxID=50990 RepID=A0A4Y7QHV0_9AGAM|nr:glutathione S-transferase [Rickenella mellea]